MAKKPNYFTGENCNLLDFYTAGELNALITNDSRIPLSFSETDDEQRRFYKIIRGKKRRISQDEASKRYVNLRTRQYQNDFTALDLFTIDELKELVMENPELGYETMETVSGQTRFYRVGEEGKKEAISQDSLREEIYPAYLDLRMQYAEEVNERAWQKEEGEIIKQETKLTKAVEETILPEVKELLPAEPVIVEEEPEEDKLFETYKILGITQERNGVGPIYFQDKRNNFKNGDRSNRQKVSADYVLNAVAAYVEYEKLIESDNFDNLDWAYQLAEVFFPVEVFERVQRRLFDVYTNGEDAGRLYHVEAGIDDIRNPIHASSDTEWELKVEEMTMPLSGVEADEFDREQQIDGLNAIARAFDILNTPEPRKKAAKVRA